MHGSHGKIQEDFRYYSNQLLGTNRTNDEFNH